VVVNLRTDFPAALMARAAVEQADHLVDPRTAASSEREALAMPAIARGHYRERHFKAS
jgi:hypothetical protein